MKARRIVSKKLQIKQNVMYRERATLGNGSGVVDVPGRAGYVYARVGEITLEVHSDGAVPHKPGLGVVIGYAPDRPSLLRVLGVDSQYVAAYNSGNRLGAHHTQHEWPGSDTVFVGARQILPLRIAVDGFNLTVYPGFLWIENDLKLVQTSEPVSLLDYLPMPGEARLAWITVDDDGLIVLVIGDAVDEDDLGLDDVPTWPEGTYYVLGAVRLYGTQLRVSDGSKQTDILDLRFPVWQRKIDQLAVLTDVLLTDPEDGQVLTYDEDNEIWINADPTGGGGGGSAIVTTKNLVTRTVISDQLLTGTGSFSQVSIPSGYDHLEIVINAIGTADSGNFLLTFNGDTTDANYRRTYNFGGDSNAVGAADQRVIGDTLAGGSGKLMSVLIAIPNHSATDRNKVAIISSGERTATSGGGYANHGSLHWENNNAITTIDVTTDGAASFTTGSILTVIGIKEEEVVIDVTGVDNVVATPEIATKATIEATSPDAGSMGFATDTSQLGIYDGSNWHWYDEAT